MDWVKPKQRARQLDRSRSPDNEITASAWLKQLCEENVALLQASLPIDTKKSKRQPAEHSIEAYVRAITWGIGVWEIDSEVGPSTLEDLVQAFGPTPKSHPRSKKKGASPLAPNQIATAKKVGAWITEQLPKASYDPYVALTSAAWIHSLSKVGKEISPTLWLEVLQSIMTQVNRAWENGAEDGLFPWIVWGCEIPLGLAKQLSHLGGKDRIVSDALNRIAQLLEEASEEPLPLLRYGAQDLRPVLASVVRSRWSADELGARKWYPPQRKAIVKLASYALALADPNGRQLLFDESNTEFDPSFWTSIYHLAGSNRKFANTVACALPDKVGKELKLKPSKLRKDKSLDSTLFKQSHYWEKSSIATMRRSWRHHGCRVAIDFSSDVIWLDLIGEKGERIFSGDWEVTVKKDGKEQLIDHAWQEVCWFTDDDVDYLELECSIGDECSIQRQIMLMREEGMLFVADALLAKESARWRLQSSWTPAEGVRFVSDAKNTEAKLLRDAPELGSHEIVALLLPVAASEWKRDASQSWIDYQEDLVVVKTECEANNLYSPLLIPMRNLRDSTTYTWRQLTVAEELAIQPKHVAGAYRVQIDRDQWVFYRSLTPCTRRTVMGLHLNTEFYTGRFCADDGQFEAMLEVNP